MVSVNQLRIVPDRIAEDILASDGGVIKRRGPVAYRQTVDNGFSLFRQHMNGQGGCRPAPSIGGYPNGMIIAGIGQDVTGYGSQDDGGATYCNLDRSREGVWVTDSFKFGLIANTQADSVGDIRYYVDTQSWKDDRRSYYEVKLSWADDTIQIMSSSGTYVTVDASPNLPGFNQNKYDSTYMSFTYWLGVSGGAASQFGGYGALQIGAKTYDLRGLNAGIANYAPQVGSGSGGAIGSLLMESFAGGRNPGFSVQTPVPGKWGGIVLYRWEETIGDTLV